LGTSGLNVSFVDSFVPLNQFTGAPTSIAPGETFVFGVSGLPEAQATTGGLSTDASQFEFIDVLGFEPLAIIDSLGHVDAPTSTAPWSVDTIYTADPKRLPDTMSIDAFDISDDFTATAYCFLAGTAIATPGGE